MAKKWTTTRSEGSVPHVSKGGFLAREGTPEHTHHQFYARYQPQAITSFHRSSPTKLSEKVRKRRQAKE